MGTRSAVDVARAHGFSLQSVCWGYRSLFESALQDLLESGAIGAGNAQSTRRLFEMLGRADRSSYDHVLKELLTALTPSTRWILELPGIFGDVVDLGRRLAEARIHFGTTFFALLGSGSLGRSPGEMRALVNVCNALMEHDAEFALAFARGFTRLRDRLEGGELDHFVAHGLRLRSADRRAQLAYFASESTAAENVIRSITRECRLDDVSRQLAALIRAIVGHEVEIADLGNLDSDDLIERGTTFVCLARWCYVPVTIRAFDTVEANRDWYRLLAVVSAAMISRRSLPSIHGAPDVETIADLTGPGTARQNLAVIVEYARVIAWIRREWPGARRLLDLGIRTDFAADPATGPPERLLQDLIDPARAPGGRPHADLQRIVRTSVNVLDTVALLVDRIVAAYPELGRRRIRAFRFLPDFFYAARVEAAPSECMVADLRSQADEANRRREGDEAESSARAVSRDGEQRSGETGEQSTVDAAFLYDEWDHVRGQYHENYCRLHEIVPEAGQASHLAARVAEQAKRVRRVFENIKPELSRKEKYLQEGDEINADLLYDYLIDARREPSPRVRFYERPRIQTRDLAVLILLDASGSTSDTHGETTIIDLEKEATVILAEALHSLDDRFEIGGFTTRGPENCEYLLFKSIDDDWDEETVRRLDRAHPANSTRMGAALRHAGWRLSTVEARQRLLIVITDGRPMDDRYSPETRYAQYDVRMACEENRRRDIHTFAISTEENSFADMEIMFPQHRFSILRDMRDLPLVLPRLYVRLTV